MITTLNQFRSMARLVLNRHQKDICYGRIGLCLKYLSSILGSIVNKIGRAHVIGSRESESSRWTLHVDEAIPNPIQKPKMYVELKVPIIGYITYQFA